MALVKTDVSEERVTSIIKMNRIGELETLSVTSNVHPKRRFLQEPHSEVSIFHSLSVHFQWLSRPVQGKSAHHFLTNPFPVGVI
jgi:hypothetical protein